MYRCSNYIQKKNTVEKVSINERFTPSIRVGEVIKRGTPIYIKEDSKIVARYDLKLEFNDSVDKVKGFVKVAEGQFVVEGDLLAEKKQFLGIAEERILSKVSGIISLEDIDDGILLVISERVDTEFLSLYNGSIESIKQFDGIYINVPYFSVNRVIGTDAVSKIDDILHPIIAPGAGGEFNIDMLDESVSGSAVYVGGIALPKIVKQLYEAGATCIIAWSIDSKETLVSINDIPVIILSKYGLSPEPKYMRRFWRRSHGSTVRVVKDTTGLFSLMINISLQRYELSNYPSFEGKYIQNLKVGDYVISRKLDDFRSIYRVIFVDEKEIVVHTERGNMVMKNSEFDYLKGQS